jgi:hypothetical protein
MTCLKPENNRRFVKPNCLGSTCMKWTSSGELSDVDLNNILERLAQVDANVVVMDSCHLDEQPADR